ncbi:MAG: NifU family protein [Candidatus Melainabacteria bacterium]|jgi:Fe-S cluster biogenesis protein NfuA
MNTENTQTQASLNVAEEMTFQSDVLKLIDEKIRPALMMDGGDMAVHGFNKLEGGQYEMVVQLVGACGSCPSSSMTMKMGVERLVMEQFPQIALITVV